MPAPSRTPQAGLAGAPACTLPMSADEPETILFESSPLGTLDALVQTDGRTIYFYLHGPREWGTRACWVANLQPGPLEFSQADLRAGVPPLLPRIHCIDPAPAARPAPGDLAVVWFEEGNAAALLWSGKACAVIPPWSGRDGFHGYAANCASENLVCWPMPAGDSLNRRIDEAIRFWQRWQADPPFRTYQPAWLAHCTRQIGPQLRYWSTDGGRFPPRGIAAFQSAADRVVLVTAGLALFPQPLPDLEHPPPQWRPHFELALPVPAAAVRDSVLEQLVARLAMLAVLPWRTFVWFGAGQTCELLREIPALAHARFLDHPPDGLPELTLPLEQIYSSVGTVTPAAAGVLWLNLSRPA